MAQASRKLANPLALAVMVLLYERPMHPYEMAATLRERRKEDSIKLRYGSLYTVIELLVREGFITPKKTTREGNRPERTIYEITDAGETEVREWMREILSKQVKEFPQFEAGLSLLPALPPGEAIEALQIRLDSLEKTIERLTAGLRNSKTQGLPPLFSIETEYWLSGIEAERTFVEKLISRIKKDGVGYLKEWKKWHAQKAPKKSKQ
jgi:DNA-binding PadR family transcriptional regulator